MKDILVAYFVVFSAGFIWFGCCAAPPPPAPPPLSPEEPQPPAKPAPEPKPALSLNPDIWTTPNQVETDCEKHLKRAAAIRDEIVAIDGEHTLENTLKRVNEFRIEIASVRNRAYLFSKVSPIREVRTAAEKCQQDVQKLSTDFSLNRDVYDAIAAVKTDGLGGLAKRFLERELLKFRRSGVDKDDATRAEIARMKAEMLTLGQDFRRRVREDIRFIEVTKRDLKGIPEDFLASHPPDENGKIQISTKYPDFFPVMNHVDRAKVRKELYYEFLNRGHPENAATLKSLLDLRHKYATLLGYSDWADYNAEDKMVKNKQVIDDFIEEVADIARPRMKSDLKQILARKKKDQRNAARVEVWDRFYYVNKIKAEKYDVDALKVRSYFAYPNVRDGLLAISGELFGLTFERVEGESVWHKTVEVYNVFENGRIIGRFYLDMHPREGKFGHAAQMSMRIGVKDVQLPTIVLVCNFPEPADSNPGLIGHDQVIVFFHEFGHLMHSIVAGRHEWITQSGITCEWDFVETPSSLLEAWAWDYESLKKFAKHHETGETISKALVQKMRDANEFGKGAHVMRQNFYAALSFTLHEKDPSEIDLLSTHQQTLRKYNPYPYPKGTHGYASFEHLIGYSSQYYTYLWSLVLAKEIEKKFEEAGMLDAALAEAYRKKIIEPGGTIDADVMMKNFLGRDYNFEAFEQWLGQ